MKMDCEYQCTNLTNHTPKIGRRRIQRTAIKTIQASFSISLELTSLAIVYLLFVGRVLLVNFICVEQLVPVESVKSVAVHTDATFKVFVP